jgi:crotonobetainyl-CoA:carnitine CoA-transferase CaiB-like acyl-CoA transferase
VTGLLDGIRVIDLSRVLAGPFAAQILAEMGADVIKVEPPAGDMARGIGPFVGGRSLYYSALNTGKRGVVLDLATAPGRRSLDALLTGADIVIENYRPEAVRKLGLTPGELLAAHPHLVVVTISGYARSSSRAADGAYDLVAQAESGIMAITGEPGGRPVRAGVAISDLAAGLWGALGAVAAYAARIRDGAGRHVEVPLLDSALSLLTYVATAAMGTGVDPEPVGSGHHNIVPYRAFATSDGWVVIAVIGDKFWNRLCTAFDIPGDRVDLRQNRQRVAARDEVDRLVEEAIGRVDTKEALRRLAEAGVPHGPLPSVLDALRSPYVRASGNVASVDAPEGRYHVVQGPLRTGEPLRPAPALGEHTREVMTEVLGPDAPDLQAVLNGWDRR